MLQPLSSAQIDLAIAALSALSAFAAVITAAWPYVMVDRTAERLRRIRQEREAMRVRARAGGAAQSSLTPTPGRLWRLIVETFSLARRTDGGAVAAELRRAGFRGQRAVYVYLAARAVAPLALLLLAAGWLYGLAHKPSGLLAQALILAGAGAAGWLLPRLYVTNQIQRRREAILRAWPDALDLMLICVESGMTVEAALMRVADEIGHQSVELAEELHLCVAELAYLQNRRQAYENLGVRTGLFAVRATVGAFMQSERYGTSLGRALRVLAREQRDARMIEAERKAASLPPKLTVPMILFFLPVLFVVILMPAAIKLMTTQGPPS